MNFQSFFKLFKTKESEYKISQLIENNEDDYINILKNIEKLLISGNHYAQAEVVKKINLTLADKDYPKFKKRNK